MRYLWAVKVIYIYMLGVFVQNMYTWDDFSVKDFFLSAKNEIKLREIQKGYPNPFT